MFQSGESTESAELKKMEREIDHAIRVRKELGVRDAAKLHLSKKAFAVLQPKLTVAYEDGEIVYYYRGLKVEVGLLDGKNS